MLEFSEKPLELKARSLPPLKPTNLNTWNGPNP